MNILAGRGKRSSVTAVQNLSTNWKKTTSRMVPRKDLRYSRQRESENKNSNERSQDMAIRCGQNQEERDNFWSNYRIPVHYYILEAASFEELGISIHLQLN